MKGVKIISALLVLLFAAKASMGQDIHFSQFYNSPLTLNPALTGKVYGTYRFTVNYRNQWIGVRSGESTYSTPAFSFDMPIRFRNKDILGVGVYLVNDRSSGGNLKNLTGMLSLAFHKALGERKNHVLSLGVQVGYVQRKLDVANIKLADQIDLQNELFTGASMDELKGSSGYFDFQTGFHWNSQFTERVNIYAGYSLFHVLEPSYSFTGNDLPLPMRNVVNAGADFSVSQTLDLMPSIIYMTQAKAKETNVGVAAGLNIGKDAALYLGGYYRISDAVIPYLGFSVKGFKMGMSYDVTTSDLQNSNGSIEFSLTYVGKYIPVPDVVPSLYCPRF